MQQAVLHDTIEAYEKNLQLTTDRFNGGVASKADITLAQTQLAGARAQSTDLRVARAQFEHAIATLTGRPPAALDVGASTIGGPPPPIPAIPLAVPSQLLERRPDIAASERQVAAANANVGLAEAAYYPTLTLSANLGLVATNLANLVQLREPQLVRRAPTLSQTVFDFGRRRAQLEGAQAAYDATVAAYRQTVLTAFQEVEDDLASLRYLAEEAAQQQEAVAAAQQSLSLEIDRYKAGTDSYLNVITTQTIALSDQQTAITILQRRMSAAVGSRQGARRRLGRLDAAVGRGASVDRAGQSAVCGRSALREGPVTPRPHVAAASRATGARLTHCTGKFARLRPSADVDQPCRRAA